MSTRRWFISYNSEDIHLVEGLEAALRQKDPEGQIFFAPKSLRAGGYWLPELAREIAEATAFVLLIGRKGVGHWQLIEYYEAYDKRVKSPEFTLAVILLEGEQAPGLPFLRQLHWVVTADPTSDWTTAQLLRSVTSAQGDAHELWRYTVPYRGLAAMKEEDSEFFFGRERETVEIIATLASNPGKLPVLIGNSGVGKSSLAHAGVLSCLKRQAWPAGTTDDRLWPSVFADSRRWCFFTVRVGAEPLRALVEAFLCTWQMDATDTLWAKRRADWTRQLSDGSLGLRDLLDATERRSDELARPKPPAFCLYIDQGEELYVHADEPSRRRFSEVIAEGLQDRRLHALMSLRADFFGQLQNDEALYNVHCQVNVAPLREVQLRDVITKPATMLQARFEDDALANHIAQGTAEESTQDAGALPLLSYLLDDMWSQMVARGDGTLRLPARAIDLAGVLAARADSFLEHRPGAEVALRRILILKLATVRADGAPTRRSAPRAEFSDEEWQLVTELANHPHRLVVTATRESGEAIAEVAHEAIFRRWDKLREWIANEREFLSWRSEIEPAERRWLATPEPAKTDALLTGLALTHAQSWLAQRPEDLSQRVREFVEASVAKQAAEREQRELSERKGRRLRLAFNVLLGCISIPLVYLTRTHRTEMAFHASAYLERSWPNHLSREAELALQPGQTFSECRGCPVMVVIPAGEFIMGVSEVHDEDEDEDGRPFGLSPYPPHRVVLSKPFAVSKFEVTFAEWDACRLLGGGCVELEDRGWGHGSKPAFNLSWDDAQIYTSWLSSFTGKPYRLLTESEWEYAARAGSDSVYSWGDDIGQNRANCKGCGSLSRAQTTPVGSFAPNAFGLHDMHGNVSEWVEDSDHQNYEGAPTDGSAWPSGAYRVHRGGAWDDAPDRLSVYHRGGPTSTSIRAASMGLRIARTLDL